MNADDVVLHSGCSNVQHAVLVVLLIPDICRQSAETGPCRSTKTRYFYDVSVGECRQFTYGGCNGNANRFLTLDNCRAVCSGVDHVPGEAQTSPGVVERNEQTTTREWKIAKEDATTTLLPTTEANGVEIGKLLLLSKLCLNFV